MEESAMSENVKNEKKKDLTAEIKNLVVEFLTIVRYMH